MNVEHRLMLDYSSFNSRRKIDLHHDDNSIKLIPNVNGFQIEPFTTFMKNKIVPLQTKLILCEWNYTKLLLLTD